MMPCGRIENPVLGIEIPNTGSGGVYGVAMVVITKIQFRPLAKLWLLIWYVDTVEFGGVDCSMLAFCCPVLLR